MKIKALVPFSNGTLSMEQYQVAEVTDTLGNQLIAAGVAIEIGGGGTGGGVLVVNGTWNEAGTEFALDKTWQEIHDAMLSGGAVLALGDDIAESVVSVGAGPGGRFVIVLNVIDLEWNFYVASAADGYPVINE